MSAHSLQPPRTSLDRLLDWIERVGNKVPHPAVIFLLLALIVIVLSHLFHLLGTSVSYQVIDPSTHEPVSLTASVNSLLTVEGLRFILTSPVRNFLGFVPVGVILVAMVGVGVAEEAGLIKALIRKIVLVAPRRLITFIVVFMGALSSVASDAGYLVLIPLGAAAFLSLGRHPIAGLAAAFAGVAAVFGVNLIITPVDAVLTEITNDAAHLLDPGHSLDLTANLYFSIASTIVMSIICTVITERIVEPRLGQYLGERPSIEDDAVTPAESRGLRFSLWALIGTVAVLALAVLPPGAPLRHPATGAIIGNTPFMNSLIVLIMVLFLTTGLAYGRGARTINTASEAMQAITKTFSGLGGLVFLFLVIAQFLAYFNYSNMATIAAVELGAWVKTMNLGPVPLLVGFIVVTIVIGIIMPPAIAKWALLAPIFVPLFMKLDIQPAMVLAAYRVADSPINVVTPLMAYFGMIVVFARRYDPEAGIGTVVAMMLPYGVLLYVLWTVFFLGWYLLGIPVGPH